MGQWLLHQSPQRNVAISISVRARQEQKIGLGKALCPVATEPLLPFALESLDPSLQGAKLSFATFPR